MISINNINPNQDTQNTYHPSRGKTSNRNPGAICSVNQGNACRISSEETDSHVKHVLGIIASIDNLQGFLENMNVVHDPPFFPIAKYQRIDLILKIGGIQEAIEKSSLTQDVKQTVSNLNVKKNATDKELSAAIGGLFALRDNLINSSNIPVKNTKPGSILTMKA